MEKRAKKLKTSNQIRFLEIPESDDKDEFYGEFSREDGFSKGVFRRGSFFRWCFPDFGDGYSDMVRINGKQKGCGYGDSNVKMKVKNRAHNGKVVMKIMELKGDGKVEGWCGLD